MKSSSLIKTTFLAYFESNFIQNQQQIKKDKTGEYDLILSIREKQVTETILIFILLYFLLILYIKTIYNICIYIEKIITNLVINV